VADSRRDRVMAACAAKAGSVEHYPFGDEGAVFKVADRMFALVPLGLAPGSVSLLCDPGPAADLRGRYVGITPATTSTSALEHRDAGRFVLMHASPR
jgi:predicted DNA-binding protein (MmcQ/YjbR family)